MAAAVSRAEDDVPSLEDLLRRINGLSLVPNEPEWREDPSEVVARVHRLLDSVDQPASAPTSPGSPSGRAPLAVRAAGADEEAMRAAARRLARRPDRIVERRPLSIVTPSKPPPPLQTPPGVLSPEVDRHLHSAARFGEEALASERRLEAALKALAVTPTPRKPVAEEIKDIAAWSAKRKAALIDVQDKCTRPLTAEEQSQAEKLMRMPSTASICAGFNVTITGRDMSCLRDGVWLTDEVINFYLNLLSQRMEACARAGGRVPKCHFFNSFFNTKLGENGYNYAGVKRWSKKANVTVMALDKVICPVNIGNTHWTLAVINLRDKRFEYYDSLGGDGTRYLQNLRRYVKDEAEAYSQTKLDLAGWTDVQPKDIPRQMNGCDCGVFTVMYANYISEDRPLSFSQKVAYRVLTR